MSKSERARRCRGLQETGSASASSTAARYVRRASSSARIRASNRSAPQGPSSLATPQHPRPWFECVSSFVRRQWLASSSLPVTSWARPQAAPTAIQRSSARRRSTSRTSVRGRTSRTNASLADAEAREHLVEHAVADFDAAQLSDRRKALAYFKRDDLSDLFRAPRGECGSERIARRGGHRLLACGRDEGVLATLPIGNAGEREHTALELVETVPRYR